MLNSSFGKFIIWTLPGFTLFVFLIYSTVPEPEFNSDDELYEFAQQFKDGVEACELYAELLRRKPNNSKYQLAFAREWFMANEKKRLFLKHQLQMASLYPLDRYEKDLNDGNTVKRNSALFGLATTDFYNDQTNTSTLYLDSISIQNYPGKNLMLGMISARKKNYEVAKDHFQKEIVNDGLVDEAWEKLINVTSKTGIDVNKILGDTEFLTHSPLYFKRFLYFSKRDYPAYFLVLFQQIYNQLITYGAITAFLVMLIWLLYLLKLGRLCNFSLSVGLLALCGGIVIALPVLATYDIYRWVFHFGLRESGVNDLLYSVFGIGLIEEVFKLVPVLILMQVFRHKFQHPADFIIAAIFSGLGFTFIEDAGYITNKKLDIVSFRTLFTGTLHMTWSAIAIYGFVMWKFKKRNKYSFIVIIAFFFLALVFHGLYDFWIFHKAWILSLIVAIFSINLWVSILNNALNNSGAYVNYKMFNVGKTNFGLITALCCVILIEYLIYSIVHGPSSSNTILLAGIKTGLYTIPFLAYRLSRIDIAPAGWELIDFTGVGNTHDLNKIINKGARIVAYRNFGVISKILPMEGSITDRLTVNNDKDWFLFIPDENYSAKPGNFKALLIKPKLSGASLTESNLLVHIRLVKDLSLIAEHDGLSDFPFVDWGVFNCT